MTDAHVPQLPKPGDEYRRPEVFVGKWRHEGESYGDDQARIALICVVIAVVFLMLVFLTYERWRFSGLDVAARPIKD